jgi:hypothetical protein
MSWHPSHPKRFGGPWGGAYPVGALEARMKRTKCSGTVPGAGVVSFHFFTSPRDGLGAKRNGYGESAPVEAVGILSRPDGRKIGWAAVAAVRRLWVRPDPDREPDQKHHGHDQPSSITVLSQPIAWLCSKPFPIASNINLASRSPSA